LTISAAIKAHFLLPKCEEAEVVFVTQVDKGGFEALVTIGEVLVVDWISLSL
jgi:hypothetical protein